MTTPQSPQASGSEPSAATFGELSNDDAVSVGAASLDTLLDVTLPVAIEFGRTSMTVQEILELGPGSVVQLDRMVGEPVDIFVSDRRLAEGEIVVIGEHFGVRITRIVSSVLAGDAAEA